MTTALTSQVDEIFVREMILYNDPQLACMRSGMNVHLQLSVLEAANRTMQREEIARAVAEGRRAMHGALTIEYTNRSIAEDMEHIYREGLVKGDLRACIAAKQTQLQALGLLVTKVEVTRKRKASEMTTAELEDYLRQNKVIEGEGRRVVDVDDAGAGGIGPKPASGGG